MEPTIHINTQDEAVPLLLLLRDIEKHGRTEDQDLANLTEQMLTLAMILHRQPKENGLGLIALGGIQYLLDRLKGHFNTTKSLPELRDVYAGVELGRYPVYDPAGDNEQMESMKRLGQANGLVFRAIKVPCSDGQERVIFASHTNQTSFDGKIVLSEGEVVFDPAYYPPPFRVILDQLPPA